LNYISNLINLQSKKDRSDLFYPASESIIEDFFNDQKFNPHQINPEKIKYQSNLLYKDLLEICETISYIGKSGLNFLENLENSIDLNKPIILYYGIMQLGVFYSNLHFNFTSYNKIVSNLSKNIKTHGIDMYELKQLGIEKDIRKIIIKGIKLKKAGVAMRFFMAYKPSLLNYFLKEEKVSLIDLLKNYFWDTNLKRDFQQSFGFGEPEINFNSKIFTIYLLSFYFSTLSRYKMETWNILLEDRQSKIGYFMKYFLKFAKSEFITLLFEKLIEEKHKIPEIIYMGSVMDI